MRRETSGRRAVLPQMRQAAARGTGDRCVSDRSLNAARGTAAGAHHGGAPPGIGFRNSAAVRAALISSAFATLAGVIPLPGLFHTLWQLLAIVAGGFVSVYLYHRRTGDYLSVRGGLQIGWMTGVFCFVVTMVMLTVLLAILSALGEAGMKQLSAQSGQPEFAEAFGSMMSNPAMLIFALVTVFFFMTMLGSAGGALGIQGPRARVSRE